MRQRIRFRDGTNRDINHGGGPVGKRPGTTIILHALPIGQAIPPVIPGLWPASNAALERKRRARHGA